MDALARVAWHVLFCLIACSSACLCSVDSTNFETLSFKKITCVARIGVLHLLPFAQTVQVQVLLCFTAWFLLGFCLASWFIAVSPQPF